MAGGINAVIEGRVARVSAKAACFRRGGRELWVPLSAIVSGAAVEGRECAVEVQPWLLRKHDVIAYLTGIDDS